MRALLDECAAATAANPRISGTFECLLRNPTDILIVLAWDSYTCMVEKSSDHNDQRITFSGKVHDCALTRLEAIDMTGRPVFFFNLAMSQSPKGCDASIAAFQLELEATAAQAGGFQAVVTGLPGYTMVFLGDKGEQQKIEQWERST